MYHAQRNDTELITTRRNDVSTTERIDCLSIFSHLARYKAASLVNALPLRALVSLSCDHVGRIIESRFFDYYFCFFFFVYKINIDNDDEITMVSVFFKSS